MRNQGMVYFVGAGPGDPKLITVKGMEILNRADVIVYDRLLDTGLLEYAPKHAVKINCGKQKDFHTIPQEEINRILVAHAQEGRIVVRLKGGDPSVFGRVGEEAEYCADHGISYEIVPGVTSGIAAPIYAGIPVTHRNYAASVAFVTGHRRTDREVTDIAWEHLAKGVDTLVFYMGVSNLPNIQEQLMKHGRPSNTPVALIRWGTMEKQEVLTGELWNIAEEVEKRQFASPAIIVVGEVVKLREKLNWFQGNMNPEEYQILA
ncbi:uroporphyrinogen-III C-methyltransferase [Ammoniphilus sp. 3BR4]|uniref:uroporphyrinogen-III C-methyltransferase n=1 Tax=Ammoniphilus sp. 3BR4 TaxID=3158265 RepID=UPI0034673F4B